MVILVVTILVVVISVLLQYFFSLFEILFKKPLPPKGAVEIDSKEHVYAHPDFADHLQDPKTFEAQTIYEGYLHGVKVGGDRPQFSYRQSSSEPFKSYSYK